MPQKKVKLKLKSNAKKPLMIIGVILLVIFILLAFYFNRIGELKNLGYSEEAAKSIIFKFKFSFLIKFLNFLANGSFSVLSSVVISKYLGFSFFPVPKTLIILILFFSAYLISSTFIAISSHASII